MYLFRVNFGANIDYKLCDTYIYIIVYNIQPPTKALTVGAYTFNAIRLLLNIIYYNVINIVKKYLILFYKFVWYNIYIGRPQLVPVYYSEYYKLLVITKSCKLFLMAFSFYNQYNN